MKPENVCRCCLAEGLHRNIFTSYEWKNNKEIYSDMIYKCFNITLSSTPEHGSNSICNTCIQSLRNSLQFKQKVLKSEEELLQRLKKENCTDSNYVKIKEELIQDSENDSDDNFLSDVKETAHNIKDEPTESPTKKPESKSNRTRSTKKTAITTKKNTVWPNDKVNNLVTITRIASKINNFDKTNMPAKNKQLIGCNIVLKKNVPKTDVAPKNKKLIGCNIVLKESLPVKKNEVNVMWACRGSNDKRKHKENLLTILKFSTATPFRNKSLLGFLCGYCDSTFPDPVDLRAHTEASHKKERLDYKTVFDMTEYSVKLDVMDLSCTLCDAKMDNLYTLKEHLVKIHNKNFHDDVKDHMLQFKLKKGEVYDCALCTSTYETFKMLKQHMNKHYCNYSCTKCDTSFATKRSLNAHKAIHEEGSFKCDQCEKVFSTKTKKQYHEKIKHLGARNISNCPFCNEPFRSYYQRNQHMVKVHNSEAQYKCNVCDKAYILKSLLMYHIKKNHLMERNCQCTECGFRFFSKKALKAHMVKHTGERIYNCQICNKSYARKYTLREHMRIHNNDRRFKCDICAIAFVQKCSLKSHLLSNHGISMAASDITSSL